MSTDPRDRRLRFGLGVPTATEGMMYPVPFADIEEAVRLATIAEDLGFDSVWGNDHVSTQRYVREHFRLPPRFYDPVSYLSFVAARTSRIRIATAVLVLPFRHPVLVAKQAATLDLLSGGRLILGVGIGAYREEFESMWPGRAFHRGRYMAEALEALGALLTEDRASYRGEYVSFEDVESYPKPVQVPLPILSGGNSAGARERAATLATGWLPACLTVGELRDGVMQVQELADRDGRALPEGFEVAMQLGVSIGATYEEASRRFRASQLAAHLDSLSGSTMKGRTGAGWETRNLIGTADDIGEQVAAYAAAGVTTFAGLLFATNTVGETVESMTAFSEQVLSRLT